MATLLWDEVVFRARGIMRDGDIVTKRSIQQKTCNIPKDV